MWPYQMVLFFMTFAALSSEAEVVVFAGEEEALEDGGGGPSDTASAGASGDDGRPSWLREALPEVASFLRSHKFHEIDRRFRKIGDGSPQGFYASFPDPPLRSWHWEVHRNCILGFEDCVRYIQRVARRAASWRRRHEDDAEASHDGGRRRRARGGNQTEADAKQCRAQLEKDLKSGGSFDGPLERFQWRTTASYFMCWFTMLREPALETIGQRCDNHASCLDPEDEVANGDFRAVGRDGQEMPWACAQYSFCPDPCCPGKHYAAREDCARDPQGPCAGLADGKCAFRAEENHHLGDIARDRWNVTCDCSTEADRPRYPVAAPRRPPAAASAPALNGSGGYEWQSRFAACTDIDECSLGTHACDRDRQSCLNLPGGYACTCRFGFVASDMILDRGKLDLECLRDKALQAAAGDMVTVARFGATPPDKGRRFGSFFQRALQALGWRKRTSGASPGKWTPDAAAPGYAGGAGQWLALVHTLAAALIALVL